MSSLAGVRVLVTGASGFIGGRLVEHLVVEHGARVRILVRRVMGAVRAARFPIEVVVGDLTDPAADSAVDGCAVVFNCAKGRGADRKRRRAVDIEWPERLVPAARAAGARVVHLSTMAVYDIPRNCDLDERSPPAPAGDVYSDDKLAGERAILRLGARESVAVSVIQPTVVYGPFAGVYGKEILEELESGHAVLIDGGRGICNAVYIDDLVRAIILAATTPRAAGERFLISGPEYPTWREFFAGFERMIGRTRIIDMSEQEALDLWRRTQRRPWLLPELLAVVREDRRFRQRLLRTHEGHAARRAAELLLPGALLRARAARRRPRPPTADSPHGLAPAPMRPWVVRYLAKRAQVRIDKAREVLSYRPAYGLEEGMRFTEAWARWAGYLP